MPPRGCEVAVHIAETGEPSTHFIANPIYNYTLSFVMEEQAVYPRQGERLRLYDVAKHNTELDPCELPLIPRTRAFLIENFEPRRKEELALIVDGVARTRRSKPREKRHAGHRAR